MRLASTVGFKVNPEERVPLASLKSEDDGTYGGAVLGATSPRVFVKKPDIKWTEESGAKPGTIKLGIQELRVDAHFSVTVKIASEIDQNSGCFKFVQRHEEKHVAAWRKGVEKISMNDLTNQIKMSHPILTSAKPTEVAKSKMKATQVEIRDGVAKLVFDYLKMEGEKISKKSKIKVDSSDESLIAGFLCNQN